MAGKGRSNVDPRRVLTAVIPALIALALGVVLALASGSHPHAQATCNGTTMAPTGHCFEQVNGRTRTNDYAEQLHRARSSNSAGLILGIVMAVFGALILALVLFVPDTVRSNSARNPRHASPGRGPPPGSSGRR